MAGWDEVVSKAKDFAGTAEKQAEKVLELSKLKLQIAQINNEIKQAYEKLGSAVYHMKKADYEDQELIASVSEEIDELFGRLEAVQEKLARLKNQTVCGSCGTVNPRGASYCCKCGARLVPEEDGEPEAAEPVEEE